MLDFLARTERLYGSVAEYNRCMDEERVRNDDEERCMQCMAGESSDLECDFYCPAHHIPGSMTIACDDCDDDLPF